jgi:hypothetical protein
MSRTSRDIKDTHNHKERKKSKKKLLKRSATHVAAWNHWYEALNAHSHHNAHDFFVDISTQVKPYSHAAI